MLTVTVIGAPLAFGIAFGLWPLAAFVGYLVAGIAIGDWIVGRLSPGVTRERPYLAAVVGLLVLEVVSILPLRVGGRNPLRLWRRTATRMADPSSRPDRAFDRPPAAGSDAECELNATAGAR